MARLRMANIVEHGPEVLRNDNSSKDTLIIMRTHNPSEGMLKRIRPLAHDVATELPSALFLLSVDDTNLTKRERLSAPFLRKEDIFRYNWGDIRARFPKMPEKCSGYDFHAEPIAFTVERVRHRVAANASVWVLEDDVLICGSFAKVVAHFQGDRSDLITSMPDPAGLWVNKEKASAAFKQLFPDDERRSCQEFVQRFSMRFLENLQKLMDEGVHAHSEMFVPTACLHQGFSMRIFEERLHGAWHFRARIMPEDEEAVCRFGFIMNHAAKGVQEFSREHHTRKEGRKEAKRKAARKEALLLVRTRSPSAAMLQRLQQAAFHLLVKLPSTRFALVVDRNSSRFATPWLSEDQVFWSDTVGLQAIRRAVQHANASGCLRSKAVVWVIDDHSLPCEVEEIVREYEEDASDLLTPVGPVQGVRRFSMRLLRRLRSSTERFSGRVPAAVCQERGYKIGKIRGQNLTRLGSPQAPCSPKSMPAL